MWQLALVFVAPGVQAQPGAVAATQESNGYYRWPALHGRQLFFVAEGDLWRVGVEGGRAERLTSHPGAELRPAVSPDGRWLAFVASYEGPQEAYVMPAEGGLPRRLTWDGQAARVWGFSPAGEVLISTRASSGRPGSDLAAIDPVSLLRRTLPVASASDAAFSADGRLLYFTRGGLPSDNTRGYRGGMMAQLWVIDLTSTAEAKPVLKLDANAQRPMPFGARLAFMSDRDGRFNVWSVDAQGRDSRQHTKHRELDVRQASINGQQVVYTLGADLHRVDLNTNQDRRINIRLSSDFDQQRSRWLSPAPFVSHVAMAPNGERVILTARCRAAAFSHDSRQVYAQCDLSGEVEVWRFNADGSGAPAQMTHGAEMLRLSLQASPDGRWLAHHDKNGRLILTALFGDNSTRIIDTANARQWDYSMAWAPDGSALVTVRNQAPSQRARLLLHRLGAAASADANKPQFLTSDRYEAYSPSFSPDGRWLYFLSERQFEISPASTFSDRNMGPHFDRRTRVYALALQTGQRWPFRPKDELDDAAEAAARPAIAAASAGAAKSPPIVFEDLPSRLHEVPIAPGNYIKLRLDGKRLYLLESNSRFGSGQALRTLAIDNMGSKPELYAENIRDFELRG